MSHQEFPELTPEAEKSFLAGYKAAFPWHDVQEGDWYEQIRRGQAAFLLEAINQVQRPVYGIHAGILEQLRGIAENLHSPPLPPPTLAQAREADLETPAGRDVVRNFLATLGEAP